MSNIKPLPPFKIQVLTNFPFIDADFDALSNYELYAKLVGYLNKVIVPSENELIEAFNNLKNYVDDFLNNLNIQEEVNNKLDEMALDGTLENLLTPIVNGILTDEKLASIVYDIWGEDWNNLATKSYVDEKVAKYGIMPTASADYLGKVVQYIGVSDSTYTRGYFYECVSNGEPLIYSWREINFGGSNNDAEVYNAPDDVIINYISDSYSNLSSLITILNDVLSKGKTDFYLKAKSSPTFPNERDLFYMYFYNNGSTHTLVAEVILNSKNYDSILSYKNTSTMKTTLLSALLTYTDNVVTSISSTFTKSVTPFTGYLSTDNTASYSPSSANNPATKGYVDNNVLKFTTMPESSADYLGKVVQFIGTTDATYTKGHFYECVSDGGGTPVYSWSEINFGGGGSSIPIYELPLSSSVYIDIKYNGSLTNDTKTALINVITDMRNNSYKSAIIYVSNTSTPSTIRIPFYISVDTYNYYYYITELYNGYSNSTSGNLTYKGSSYNYDTLKFSLTIVGDIITDLANIEFITNSNDTFLSTSRNFSYTPTNDYNPSTKKYVDDNVAKYSTMPESSADYLGKVVQFIGTTDASYTKGHFYECVSDGATPPVYSWSEISFGGSGSSYYPIYVMPASEYTDFLITYSQSSNFKTYLKDFMNDALSKGYKNGILITRTQSNSTYLRPTYFDIVTRTSSGEVHLVLCIMAKDSIWFSPTRNSKGEVYYITTMSDGLITSVDGSNIISGSTSKFLPTDNTTSYTPTANYNPATKKYVDDLPTTYTGYDATKTQVLKNINGTLTWVDET